MDPLSVLLVVVTIAFAISAIVTLVLTVREARLRSRLRNQFADRLVGEDAASSMLEGDLQNFDNGDGLPFVDVLNFDLRYPLRIVLARHRQADRNSRKYVSVEDLRALDCFLRMRPSILSGHVISDLLVAPDDLGLEDAANTLVLGSPESNAATGSIMDDDRVQAALDCQFVRYKDGAANPRVRSKDRYRIRFGPSFFESRIYAQEEAFERDPTGFKGPFSDYGILAKINNPFSRNSHSQASTKIVIAAGIGGLGTWGTARFLYDQVDSLVERVGDSEFAALILVEREHEKGALPTTRLLGLSRVREGRAEVIVWPSHSTNLGTHDTNLSETA